MFTFNQNTFCFLATGCMRGFKSVPHSPHCDLLELVLHYSVLFITKEMNFLDIISFFYIWARICQLYILTLLTDFAQN